MKQQNGTNGHTPFQRHLLARRESLTI